MRCGDVLLGIVIMDPVAVECGEAIKWVVDMAVKLIVLVYVPVMTSCGDYAEGNIQQYAELLFYHTYL